MKKTLNGMAMVMALGVGLAAGFGMAFAPATAQAEARSSARVCPDCDLICGEGYGRCNPAGWCECW